MRACVIFFAAIVLLAADNVIAEEILVGPESSVSSQVRGFIEIDLGRDLRQALLIPTSRITFIRSSKKNDNNSQSELHVDAGGNQELVIRVPQRFIAFEDIKNAILNSLQ